MAVFGRVVGVCVCNAWCVVNVLCVCANVVCVCVVFVLRCGCVVVV